MKQLSALYLTATLTLVATLAACGSSNAPSGTTGTKIGNPSTAQVGNSNTSITNPNAAINANTTVPDANATTAASVSVVGTFGSVAFRAKDAIYATVVSSTQSVTVVAAISDATGLCTAVSGQGTSDGNVLLVELATVSGGSLTIGEFDVQDPNAVALGVTARAVGTALVGLLDASNVETDATTGTVNVTAYSATGPLSFTISAQDTAGAVTVMGQATPTLCPAFATALQAGAGGAGRTSVTTLRSLRLH